MRLEEKIDTLLEYGEFFKQAIKKNFPVSITQWIDLFSITTIPVSTMGKICLTYEIPAGKYGVIKYYVFSLKTGNPDSITLRIHVNGVIFPLTENITNAAIITEPSELSPIHIELKPFDIIQIKTDNIDDAQSAEVFGRIVGWIYEK